MQKSGKTGQLFSMCRKLGYTLPESHRRSILIFSSSKCFIAKTQLCRKELKVCGNHFHSTPQNNNRKLVRYHTVGALATQQQKNEKTRLETIGVFTLQN